MAGDVQPVLVHAVLLGVQPQPAARAQHLAHDRLHADARAQVVVHHGERNAGVDQGRRQEREVLLVEGAPVAAVNEHQAAAVALARREKIDGLAGLLAVGAVEVARHGGARPRGGLGPARHELRVLGDQLAVVVQLAEGRLLWRVHPRFSLHSPIASCPGRSEKEKSTVSSLASSTSGYQEGTTNVSRGSKEYRSWPMVTLPVPSTTENTMPSVQRYACVLNPFGSSWMKAAMVGIAWPPVSGLMNSIFQPWQASGSWSFAIMASDSRLRA